MKGVARKKQRIMEMKGINVEGTEGEKLFKQLQEKPSAGGLGEAYKNARVAIHVQLMMTDADQHRTQYCVQRYESQWSK